MVTLHMLIEYKSIRICVIVKSIPDGLFDYWICLELGECFEGPSGVPTLGDYLAFPTCLGQQLAVKVSNACNLHDWISDYCFWVPA